MDIWERKEGVYSTSKYVPERPECRDTKMTYTRCPIIRESQEEDVCLQMNEESSQTPQIYCGEGDDYGNVPPHQSVFP